MVPPTLSWQAVEYAIEPYPYHLCLDDKKQHLLNFGSSLQQVKHFRDFDTYILKGGATKPFLACS